MRERVAIMPRQEHWSVKLFDKVFTGLLLCLMPSI
jgi:hypothetical protein